MRYYFDESGNWSNNVEKNRLVLGGFIVKNEHILTDLNTEFFLIKKECQVESLHAAELKKDVKERCYEIINYYINEGDILIRIYPPSILLSKTKKNKEEVYSDLAAELVSDISLGDKEILVHYDMSFYYAYPVNVIKKMNEKKPLYYKEIDKFFEISKQEKALTHILRKIDRVLDKSRISMSDKKKLEDFKLSLSNNNRSKVISNYLWTELWLHVEGEEVAREKFRAKILSNTKEKNKMFDIPNDSISLNLSFEGKNEENPGIQLIDFVCNLVYNRGTISKYKDSEAVKSIFNKIAIEEIK